MFLVYVHLADFQMVCDNLNKSYKNEICTNESNALFCHVSIPGCLRSCPLSHKPDAHEPTPLILRLSLPAAPDSVLRLPPPRASSSSRYLRRPQLLPS